MPSKVTFHNLVAVILTSETELGSLDDDDDDDNEPLLISKDWLFWEKCWLLTFFQLKPLVVDIFPKNVDILPKNIRNWHFS